MSDFQKRQFLQDIGTISKTIGVQNTVEHLLPCVVECYNSDDTVHPDIYEAHAVLLFSNLPSLIEYLVRDSKRKITHEEEACPKDEAFDRRFQELQDQNTVETTANAESGDVSDCQSDYSEQSGYSSSNDNLKQLGHEYNFQDPMERVPPKNGYQGLTEILLK